MMGIKMPKICWDTTDYNKSLFVASSWFLFTYLSKMHGHSNIKFKNKSLIFSYIIANLLQPTGYLMHQQVSFIHSVFCLMTDPKPPPKRFLHTVRSRASSFKLEYPLLSLRSSSSFLRLLPRLLVTSISPFSFPSKTYFRRQFLRRMWPIQLAFCFLSSCRIFLCSLTLSNTTSFLTWSVQLIFSILL